VGRGDEIDLQMNSPPRRVRGTPPPRAGHPRRCAAEPGPRPVPRRNPRSAWRRAGCRPPRPRCRSAGRRGGGGARRCRRRRAAEATTEGGAADATGESDAREKPEAVSRAEVERTREIFFSPVGIYAAGICRGGLMTSRPYK